MSVFKYRMQNILNIKSKMEEQAKSEFATANRRVLDEEEKLSALWGRKDFLMQRSKELLEEDTLRVREILLNKSGIHKVEEEIEIQNRVLEQARAVLEQKRQKLMETRMERKTHEILKENAFEEFLQEEKAAESKEIDQLTSYIYGQKLAEKK